MSDIPAIYILILIEVINPYLIDELEHPDLIVLDILYQQIEHCIRICYDFPSILINQLTNLQVFGQ